MGRCYSERTCSETGLGPRLPWEDGSPLPAPASAHRDLKPHSLAPSTPFLVSYHGAFRLSARAPTFRKPSSACPPNRAPTTLPSTDLPWAAAGLPEDSSQALCPFPEEAWPPGRLPYLRGTACAPADCCRTGTGSHRRRTCTVLGREGEKRGSCVRVRMTPDARELAGALRLGLWAQPVRPCH